MLKDTLVFAITDWIWRELNIVYWAVNENVVERVCHFIFPLTSLKKDQVPSLNEKGIKAVVLRPESSDTGIKNAFEYKVEYKLGVFTKSVRCQVGFEYKSRI